VGGLQSASGQRRDGSRLPRSGDCKSSPKYNILKGFLEEIDMIGKLRPDFCVFMLNAGMQRLSFGLNDAVEFASTKIGGRR
jgi:hypothetical protein